MYIAHSKIDERVLSIRLHVDNRLQRKGLDELFPFLGNQGLIQQFM